MRKRIALIAAALLVCSLGCGLLVGCGGARPSKTVDEALVAVKKGNFKKLESLCATEFDKNDLIAEAFSDEGLGNKFTRKQKAVFKKLYRKMVDFDYAIGNEAVEGDGATVEVTFLTYDFGSFLGSWLTDTMGNEFAYAINSFGNGELPSSEQGLQIAIDALEEGLANLKGKTKEATVNFNLVWQDGAWKIVNLTDIRITDAMFGGAGSMTEQIGSLLN